MPKCTTADCKLALESIFSANYSGDPGNWKRISKTGRKGGPLVRVFFHRDLPLKGTVIEEGGGITSCEITVVGPWDCSGDDENAPVLDFYGDEVVTFLRQRLKASDFVFRILEPEMMDGQESTVFAIVPRSWRVLDEASQWDGHLEPFIEHLLPEGTEELAESTFASELSADVLRAELTKRGFVDGCPDEAEPGVARTSR